MQIARYFAVGVEQAPDGEFAARKCDGVLSALSAVRKARSLAHENGGAVAFRWRGDVEFGRCRRGHSRINLPIEINARRRKSVAISHPAARDITLRNRLDDEGRGTRCSTRETPRARLSLSHERLHLGGQLSDARQNFDRSGKRTGRNSVAAQDALRKMRVDPSSGGPDFGIHEMRCFAHFLSLTPGRSPSMNSTPALSSARWIASRSAGRDVLAPVS
jgi:hypothetical protein